MKIILFLVAVVIISAYYNNEVLAGLSILVLLAYICYRIIRWFIRLIRKKPADKKTIAKEQEPAFNLNVVCTSSPDYFCKISGVQYRNDDSDIGGFLGYVRSEPTNQYDKNAIAIYRNDGKHVGYIPKDETRDFRKWSGKEDLPCVGFIKDGDYVPLYGKVKIIDADKDETELEVTKFVKWLVSRFGVQFIPVGFTVNTDKTLETRQEWLDFLDEYIETEEEDMYEYIDDEDDIL